jgi:hypothetical protein
MPLREEEIRETRDAIQAERSKLWNMIRALKAKGRPTHELERKESYLAGRHRVFCETYDAHFRFPVAKGFTLHGIDVSRLDWTTRAKVLAKDIATILALGGKYDPKAPKLA